MPTFYPATATRFAAAGGLVLFSIVLSACGERSDVAQTAQQEHQHEQQHQSDLLTTGSPQQYICPMHPHVTQAEPGKCPVCGMDLVEHVVEVGGSANSISVSPTLQQSLGVRLVTPEFDSVRPSVRVPARVVADADRQLRVQARAAGWIEQLHVRAIGQRVHAGMVIAEIYAPELVEAQTELLLGAENATAAAERLRRLGIAEIDIAALQKSGEPRRSLPLRATASGLVTRIDVREGNRIEADTVLLELAPQRQVWIEAQVLPAQLAMLGEVRSAHVQQPGVGEAHWHLSDGEVVALVEPVTQTQAVRFALAADDAPAVGSWLDAELFGITREDVFLLPAEAVIRTHEGVRVVVATSDTHFEVRELELGQRYGERFEILEGIDEMDRVVASGQFLLDGETNLRFGLQRLQKEEPCELHAEEPPPQEEEPCELHAEDQP